MIRSFQTTLLALFVTVGCGDGGAAGSFNGSTGVGGGGGGTGSGNNNGNDNQSGAVQIGFLSVPADEDNPASGTVELRYAVIGDVEVQPVLFTHFGGPGNSAVVTLPVFLAVIPEEIATTLQESFALVALEEIGVGESAPLVCGDTEFADYSESALVTAGESLANECRSDYDLFDELGTPRYARDIERLRQELAVDSMSFLTYSYGTQVALTYAVSFPNATDRLVLDSPIDPRQSLPDRTVAQSIGFSRALQAFFDFCDFGTECAFGSGNAEAAFDLLYARFTAPGQLADLVRFESTVTEAMYYEPFWPQLGVYLQEVEQTGRVPAGEPNAAPGPFFGTTCTDFPIESLEEIRAADLEISANETVFRRTLYSSMFPCLSWGTTMESVDWEGGLPSVDALLAGALGDAVTPVELSDSLESVMSAASRVQIEGFSHAVGLFGEDECFDDAILDYLLRGARPPDCIP